MALSAALIEAHIKAWSHRLGLSSWPFRKHWPRGLFRHEPVQNAAKILCSGVLLSRKDVEESRIDHLDIAAPSVIGTRDDTHQFVRLYFRPRNPTQYHIEGVRKGDECYEGRQAAILTMLVFNAELILSCEGVEFSNGNMQASSNRRQVGNDDGFFQAINFESVYHEGSYDPHSPAGWDIKRARNAEVLLPSPLPLQRFLRGILCRSHAERATLLHLLGEQSTHWANRIFVDTSPGIFFRNNAFVDTVEADSGGVTVSFHPRRDGQPVKVAISVGGEHRTLIESEPREIDLSRRWRWACRFAPGTYLCTIQLEGQLAHQATFLIDDLPF